jgi:hypothetical protein
MAMPMHKGSATRKTTIEPSRSRLKRFVEKYFDIMSGRMERLL